MIRQQLKELRAQTQASQGTSLEVWTLGGSDVRTWQSCSRRCGLSYLIILQIYIITDIYCRIAKRITFTHSRRVAYVSRSFQYILVPQFDTYERSKLSISEIMKDVLIYGLDVYEDRRTCREGQAEGILNTVNRSLSYTKYCIQNISCLTQDVKKVSTH